MNIGEIKSNMITMLTKAMSSAYIWCVSLTDLIFYSFAAFFA